MAQKKHSHARLRRDVQEFRLVSLLPGYWSDHTACATQVIPLNRAPLYEALSYVWGDLSASNPIILDGFPFNITSNLESALRHLRHRDRPRVLWIDSLCINQDDHEEKGWQVDLLGSIFENCSIGLMWLGNRSEDLDTSCDGSTILPPSSAYRPRTNAKSVQPNIQEALTLFENLCHDKHLGEIACFRDLLGHQGDECARATETISALGAFVQRTWWSRVWTVQEAILPPTVLVLCGSLEMQWQKIAKSRANWMRHSSSCCLAIKTKIQHSVGTNALGILARWSRSIHAIESYRMPRARNARVDLVEVLNTFSTRNAKDPRDKVYAFLGLLPQHGRPVFPDYSVNMDQLSRHLTLKLFVSSRELLSVLNGVQRPRSNSILPSWIRDFGIASHMERLLFEHNRDTLRKNYRASKLSAARIQSCTDTSLSSVGVKIDSISQTGPISRTTTSLDINRIRQWLEMMDLRKRENVPYVAGGTLREAMTRTLVGNFVVTMFPPDTLSPGLLGLYHKVTPEEADEYAKHLSTVVLDQCPNATHKFDREAIIHLAGRRFFTTRGGYIGIGPPQTLPGDEVFVLFGGGSPYVLRPLRGRANSLSAQRSKSLPYYNLIGDCYVYGMMEGEAIHDFTKESLVFLV